MRVDAISRESILLSAVQDEILGTCESRYCHRLHGILLVVKGMSTREVAAILNTTPRTVRKWIRRFREDGVEGLREGQRTGRPKRLSEDDMRHLRCVLSMPPREVGLDGHRWSGPVVAAHVRQRYGAQLSVRQCQRILRRLALGDPVGSEPPASPREPRPGS